MNLSEYDGKYVQIKDIYGETFSGRASYGNYDFLECEYGGEEDGIFIEDFLLYNDQIETIEEIIPHGTAELWTENLILRRYRPEDAEQLYERFGTDPAMSKYSGWNPYATPEMAQETVQEFIKSYEKDHSFSWVMDVDSVVVGTIGAYDYEDGRIEVGTIGAYDYEGSRIEVGFSVDAGWQGRGFATEALREVLKYLTENEGISCVTAWCAEENIASRRVLEKAGMRFVRTEKCGLAVADRVYDKLIYEFGL